MYRCLWPRSLKWAIFSGWSCSRICSSLWSGYRYSTAHTCTRDVASPRFQWRWAFKTWFSMATQPSKRLRGTDVWTHPMLTIRASLRIIQRHPPRGARRTPSATGQWTSLTANSALWLATAFMFVRTDTIRTCPSISGDGVGPATTPWVTIDSVAMRPWWIIISLITGMAG